METKTFYNDVNEWLTIGCDIELAAHTMGGTVKDAIGALADHGVTHVLDCRIESTDEDFWRSAGLSPSSYLRCPIVDNYNHSPAESWFREVETFIRHFLLNRDFGDRIYVHCHMGINRGPSAAMLALLTYDPNMSPWDAFLAIREARSITGLVYAEAVGVRHIINRGLDTQADDDAVYADTCDFRALLNAYWTPERWEEARKGIAFYRSSEGTRVVKA